MAPRRIAFGPQAARDVRAGTDAQNKARAEGFRDMVATAGEHWPDGWVKGRGFVRDRADESVGLLEAPRSVEEVGLEYVDQIVDCVLATSRSRRPSTPTAT